MSIQISMVPFTGHPTISADDVQKQFSALWSSLPSPADVESRDNTIAFRVGSADIIIGFMPAPIPWSDLEGPCATSILWPNANSELREHKAHAIVTVRSEDDQVAQSELLTQATAAVLAASEEALGVFWGNAALVVPKALFLEFAEKVLPLGPPLHIWVDFRVGTVERGCAGFTSGMTALGHMEIEAPDSPETVGDLRERLVNIAGYLLENGPVIKDGDTIGEDENVLMRVIYSDSEFGHEGKVMRLVYERQAPAKSKWKFW